MKNSFSLEISNIENAKWEHICTRIEHVNHVESISYTIVPYTWEACVVKVCDKIFYIGRDIEDAITLGILYEHLQELYDLLHIIRNRDMKISNTVIINNLIYDLCENSSPEKGLCFSQDALDLMNQIKKFNYEHIYSCDRVKPSNRYFSIVLNEIYNTLKATYDGANTLTHLEAIRKFYPNLISGFCVIIHTLR